MCAWRLPRSQGISLSLPGERPVASRIQGFGLGAGDGRAVAHPTSSRTEREDTVALRPAGGRRPDRRNRRHPPGDTVTPGRLRSLVRPGRRSDERGIVLDLAASRILVRIARPCLLLEPGRDYDFPFLRGVAGVPFLISTSCDQAGVAKSTRRPISRARFIYLIVTAPADRRNTSRNPAITLVRAVSDSGLFAHTRQAVSSGSDAVQRVEAKEPRARSSPRGRPGPPAGRYPGSAILPSGTRTLPSGSRLRIAVTLRPSVSLTSNSSARPAAISCCTSASRSVPTGGSW